MIEMLRKLSIRSRRHVDEEELLRLADGELTAWHSRRVQRHIEQCWTCRSRYEQVQSAILGFVEYRNRIVLPHLPRPNSARERFLRKIDLVGREVLESRSARAARVLRSAIAPMINPVFATFLIVIVSAAAIFVVWQRNVPSVSASELLDRAQAWDTGGAPQVGPGVIHQAIEIHTPTVTFDHSFYRDVQGRKRPRKGSAQLQDAALQRVFQSGGVDWRQPLSASDFRKWNEHLSKKKDEVFSDRSGTLTLRTRTNASEVQEESLTVRTGDFHPVARRLVMRDLGEVEISELSYDVLPWDAVNVAELFEPEVPVLAVAPSALRPVRTVPPVAALDKSELRARLVLNEIGADTGENISIERNRGSIAITGFVETQSRKNEIDQALLGLPFVSASVSTFETRNRQLVSSGQPISVQQQDVIAVVSPLQKYLASRSLPSDQAVQLSRDLLDEALEIDRQALALDLLEKRFPEAVQEGMAADNKALLQQLVTRYLSAINVAIQKERNLIGLVIGELPSYDSSNSTEIYTAADLLLFAHENRRLSGELLSQSNEMQRPGDVILAELADALLQCERVTAQLGR